MYIIYYFKQDFSCDSKTKKIKSKDYQYEDYYNALIEQMHMSDKYTPSFEQTVDNLESISSELDILTKGLKVSPKIKKFTFSGPSM